MILTRRIAGVFAALFLPTLAAAKDNAIQVTIARASDGVEVVGHLAYGDPSPGKPIIALFHQARSSGRGEYGPIAPWLNENGFDAIMWDLRKGGDLFGGVNVTAADREDANTDYCDAYPDIVAAVEKTVALAKDTPVIIWGSSYSGSLVFRAAAELDGVDAVIAFSPASGGPMTDCRAELYVDAVSAPASALRPQSEMELESARIQRDALEAAGVNFTVVENGVHGSSMLVDDRTGSDMSGVRAGVMNWLKSVVSDKEEGAK